jgi:formylmethanofuran dehydrogenase subunit C
VAEIEQLPVHYGRETLPLSTFFRVRGSADDARLHFIGDLQRVHWLAAGQTEGKTFVEGSVGRHAGSGMSGGELEIRGDAGDFLAAELRGGRVRVLGDAGARVGAAYQGAPRGMTGGVILVHGNAGDNLGRAQRRGLIAVAGNVGDLLAAHMLAGTIVVGGHCGQRPGEQLRRGTLILGRSPQNLSSIWREGCRAAPVVLRLLDRELIGHAFPLARPLQSQLFTLHHGDMLAGGRGELLTPVAA